MKYYPLIVALAGLLMVSAALIWHISVLPFMGGLVFGHGAALLLLSLVRSRK